MKFTMDFSSLAGLITLVVLEIVLGIDNLVFIAILADKLPPKESNKARLIGLLLALIMRLVSLSVILWIVSLTKPLFSIINFTFSGHNLIMLIGGIFLLLKATIELHERIENRQHNGTNNKHYASVWIVVLQIVILDVVFSLDAVITAVGIVNHLPLMMTAVVIAMTMMLLASKPLTQFINQHPTVVVLCLSFLLVIGFSLIVESFGFHIPKGYLYTAIGFSILIELLNQISHRNLIKQQSVRLLRTNTEDVILRLIQGLRQTNIQLLNDYRISIAISEEKFFKKERYMIHDMPTVVSVSLSEIMTPRKEINWININLNITEIRHQIFSSSHTLFPVCYGELDKIIGILNAKEILIALDKGKDIKLLAASSSAMIVKETLDIMNLIVILCQSHKSIVIVTDELDVVQGLITPLDVLEALTIELPNIKKH